MLADDAQDRGARRRRPARPRPAWRTPAKRSPPPGRPPARRTRAAPPAANGPKLRSIPPSVGVAIDVEPSAVDDVVGRGGADGVTDHAEVVETVDREVGAGCERSEQPVEHVRQERPADDRGPVFGDAHGSGGGSCSAKVMLTSVPPPSASTIVSDRRERRDQRQPEARAPPPSARASCPFPWSRTSSRSSSPSALASSSIVPSSRARVGVQHDVRAGLRRRQLDVADRARVGSERLADARDRLADHGDAVGHRRYDERDVGRPARSRRLALAQRRLGLGARRVDREHVVQAGQLEDAADRGCAPDRRARGRTARRARARGAGRRRARRGSRSRRTSSRRGR